MEKIELIGVNKSFKEEKVLKDICLTLTDNKIYGFVGRNGSGKSVLFKIICGYVIADSGKIMIDGKELGKDMDFPKSIGFLLENPTFLDMYSGPDNLRLLAGVDNNISADMINKEIDSLIEEVGLKSARNKKYKKYSLGMKQRLGIAAAVLGNPDIVVLDEPTNALDDDGKDMVKRIVKMQKERGALVIISCHEMQTLEELSDEIVRLKEGRICE